LDYAEAMPKNTKCEALSKVLVLPSVSNFMSAANNFCFGASFKAYALRGIFAFPR
jgi:hypothetical protein